MRQYGALIDGSLVGDLAFVERWRIDQHQRARDPAGAAGGMLLQALQQIGEKIAHRFCGDDVGAGGIGRQTGQLATTLDVGHDQHADLTAVLTGDDGVLQIRRTLMGDQGAQRTDADPGAGIEFEVFRDTSVEHETQIVIGWIHPFDGIAGTKKPASSKASLVCSGARQ